MDNKPTIKVDSLDRTYVWDSGDPVKWGESIIATSADPKSIVLVFPNISSVHHARMIAAKFGNRVANVQIGLNLPNRHPFGKPSVTKEII